MRRTRSARRRCSRRSRSARRCRASSGTENGVLAMKSNEEDRERSNARYFTRRAMLGGTGIAAAAALGGRADASRRTSGRPVLVQVFLRGAMDGLTTVVPHGDGDLYVARPTLAVPPPGSANGARDLDGFFGLAPAAVPLLTPYSSGHLAIVHA